MSTAQQEEENARLALELAGKLHKLVTDPENASMWEKTKPDERHRFLCQKYDSFARAFPLVIRFIARDGRYNENAFRRMLVNQRTKRENRKGMEGYIEDQADYAMFLYLEECRKDRRRPNMKLAAEIRSVEVSAMRKHMKKIQQKEKDSKSEYEEESKKHMQERKDELLDFLRTQANSGAKPDFSDDEEMEPIELQSVSMPEEEEKTISFTDINANDLSFEELPIMYKHLSEYYGELIDGLADMNQKIRDLEEAAQQDKDDWLKGTVLEKKKAPLTKATTPDSRRRKNKNKK